jgi:hypothetical protein
MVLLLEEAMNFVQEVWHPLGFVDENPTAIRESPQLPGESGHVRQIGLVKRFVE